MDRIRSLVKRTEKEAGIRDFWGSEMLFERFPGSQARHLKWIGRGDDEGLGSGFELFAGGKITERTDQGRDSVIKRISSVFQFGYGLEEFGAFL